MVDIHLRHSISRKLVLLVVIAVAAAMVAATVLSLWIETKRYAVAKQESLKAVAHVFASATAAATLAGDQVAALHAMRAIGRVPGILHSRIETMDGRRLAVLGFAAQLGTDLRVEAADGEISPWTLLKSKSMQVAVPIVDSGLPVGRGDHHRRLVPEERRGAGPAALRPAAGGQRDGRRSAAGG